MARKPLRSEAPGLFDPPPAVDEAPIAPAPAAAQPIPAQPIPPHLIPANFPESWLTVIGSEFAKPYFAELRRFVSEERSRGPVFPPAPDVFNAFRYTPLDQVKVVLLGQDPYPTPGHAHGLCFSVLPGVRLPGSLQNIYRELHADLGIPPARHGHLETWARQGIFLLNTVLTVRTGSPASHANHGWETFTDAALQAVNALPRRVVFVLWGKHAQQKATLIDRTRHAILKSAHPSPMSAANGFFGSRPFSQVNQLLQDSGQTPIDWQLPAEV